jgi:hypothetical protein
MTPLPHEQVLSTLAEMSIAVVGFSMVAGIFRPESSDNEIRLFTLRDVGEIGLICAVMSALPLVVHAYGLSTDSNWRLASSVQGFWSVVAITAALRRRGSSPLLTFRQHWFIASIVVSLVVANFALLLTNVLNPGPLSGARYVSCMLLALTQAGFMFLLAAFDMGSRKPAAQQGVPADHPVR